MDIIKEIELLKKEIDIRKEEKKSLVADVNKYSKEKISLLDEITKTKIDLAKVHGRNIFASAELSKNQKLVKVAVSELNRVKGVLKDSKNEGDALMLDLAEKRDTLEEEEKSLKARDEKLKIRNKELSDSLSKNSKKAKELSDMSELVGEKKDELDEMIGSFNKKKTALNVLESEAEQKKADYIKLSNECTVKVSETKMLKSALDDKLEHIDSIKKINEDVKEDLEKEKVDFADKEKLLAIQKKSLDSIIESYGIKDKELKIKELRVNEIVRTNKISKELELLEKKAQK